MLQGAAMWSDARAPGMGRARSGATRGDGAGGTRRPGRRRWGGRDPSRRTRAAWKAAGPEDKAWAGTALRGEDTLVVKHDEAAIEQLAQLDSVAGPAPTVRSRRQLHPAEAEAHGVVGGDAAGIAAAEDQGQRLGGAAPCGLRPGGQAREAAIEVGPESRQKGIGVLKRGEVLQAQFADEAILQGLPEALDAAFGLGGAGGDEGNAEGLQHLAEVGGVLCPAQLFVEGPVGVVAEEDVEAIAVEGQRHAILGGEGVEQGGVAVQVFRGAEVQG